MAESRPAGGAKGSVTRLLARYSEGESTAMDGVIDLVYTELSKLAHHYLRKERADHTIDTRALVHEAFLKLSDQKAVAWENRKHFFGIAASTMRRVLCDYARMKAAAKRGGGVLKLRLQDVSPGLVRTDPAGLDLVLTIDAALTELEERDPIAARMIELRYYGGMTLDEISDVLEVPLRTLSRKWRFARAWLFDVLASDS